MIPAFQVNFGWFVSFGNQSMGMNQPFFDDIAVKRNSQLLFKCMIRGGKRLGTYYVEKGASQRASKVIYDREYSAIALAKKEGFFWEEIFKGADWFHFTVFLFRIHLWRPPH